MIYFIVLLYARTNCWKRILLAVMPGIDCVPVAPVGKSKPNTFTFTGKRNHFIPLSCFYRRSDEQSGIMKNHFFCMKTDYKEEYSLSFLNVGIVAQFYLIWLLIDGVFVGNVT